MTIVEELRTDRESGARRLEAEYKAGLMSLARRFCADEGDAEELVNRTLAAVVEGIDDYLEQSAFFGWMCKILENLHAKDVRRKSSRTVAGDAEAVDGARDDEAGDRIFREVDASLLRDAIAELPADMKDVLMLRYFMDLPVSRVARILSAPEGTVKWRLHCARMVLAAKLGARRPGARLVLLALLLAAGLAVGRGVYTLGTAVFGSRVEYAEAVSHAESAEPPPSTAFPASTASIVSTAPTAPTAPTASTASTAFPASTVSTASTASTVPEPSAMNTRSLLAATASLSLAAAPALALADGTWTKTALQQQAADLAPASSNLVRRPTTSMTLEGAPQQAAAAPNLMVNGVFEGHFDTSKEDDVYIMRSGVKVTFDFVAEARIDAVRIFSTWIDNGRNDIAVNSVSVRDAVGTWRTLEGSALPFANTGGIALRSVFSDPSGDPLARGATAIEIDFGTMENGYVGMAEIEILGELTGVCTVTFCDENGDPLPGVEVQTVAAGHAATAPDPSVVPTKAGFVFTGWSEALDTVLSNIRPRPVYAAPGAVLVSSGPFRTGSTIPFGLNVLAESGAVSADGAVAMTATRAPGYNNANRDPAVLVDGRFVFAKGDGDVAAIETGAQFTYELPSPRDVESVGFYTFWSDGGRDGFAFSSFDWREDGDPQWKTVSFDEVRLGLGDNCSHGSYFVSVSRAGGPLLTNAVAVRIPFPAMDNSCAGVGEIQALRAPVAAPRAAWTGETWSGTVRRPGGGSLLRRGSGTTASFVRNGAAPDAAALAALADGVVSESSAAVCPVATDAIFEALFDAPERVSRIELWTNGGGAHDGLAVNEVLFRRAGSAAFEPNDDMEPFRFVTFEADGDDASSGRQHVVIEAADGGLLAADATGVRIWFGRADNDRTDLQELEIFTDILPGTVIIVR